MSELNEKIFKKIHAAYSITEQHNAADSIEVLFLQSQIDLLNEVWCNEAGARVGNVSVSDKISELQAQLNNLNK